MFGCTYIVRFGSMRKAHKAAEWALVSHENFCQVNESLRFLGVNENKDLYLLEYLGLAGNACRMAYLVHFAIPPLHHALCLESRHSSSRAISCSF